jgi:hypothetical protein
MGDKRSPVPPLWRLPVRRFLTRENVFAIAFCLVLILLVIVTADAGPTWIYQGF